MSIIIVYNPNRSKDMDPVKGEKDKRMRQSMSKIKKVMAVLMIIVLIVNCTACGLLSDKTDKTSSASGKGSGIGDIISDAASKAAEAAGNVKDKIVDWYSSLDLSGFKKGWDKAVDFMGDTYSAIASSKYVEDVGKAIEKVRGSISSAYGSAKDVVQEASFAAEKWAAGTFSMDTASHKSSDPGEEASLKYYQTSDEKAQTQAAALIEAYKKYSNKKAKPLSFKEYVDKNVSTGEQKELLGSVYRDEDRIIPEEQMSEASDYLKGKVSSLSEIEGEAAYLKSEAYQETLKDLKGRLDSPAASFSVPASYEVLQAIAELAQEGEYKPEDFGVSISEILTPKYILKQAVGTAMEDDFLKTVLTVGPDLISIAVKAINAEKISEEDLEKLGIQTAMGMSRGEIEGSLSSMIYSMCQDGTLGEAFTDADPSVVGALVCLTTEAMVSGYSLVKGDITAEEYGYLMADKTLITVLAMPATAALINMLPSTRLFMMAGCLAGGVLADTGYTIAKEMTLAIINGGGFEAIVPARVSSKISEIVGTAKEAVSRMNLSQHLSNLKEFAVSTTTEGIIAIKEIIDKD